MLIKTLFAGLCFAGLLPFIFCTLSAGVGKNNKSTSDINKHIIIVLTVDGKVSALDARQEGNLLWSTDLNNGPLISSSITKLIYEKDGKTVRLVPSLHGGLFQFDGESVEAVPFDADQLLRSSFRLAENTVLVGGKETCFTGVNVKTGEVLYTCSAKGCDQQQNVKESNDVVVVKRYQQTVRSIENRNGAENWNFSVGEIDLQFLKGSASRLLQHTEFKEKPSKKEYYDQSSINSNDFNFLDASQIKFVVPDGTVCMVTSNDQHLVLWKHTFSSAIVSAWYLSDGHLQRLDMFDASKVPALGKDKKSASSGDVVYMGSFNKQVYIQASPSVQRAVLQAVTTRRQSSSGLVTYNTPRFTHRPCFSSTKYLTMSGSNSKKGKESGLILPSANGNGNQVGKHIMFCYDERTAEKGYYFQGDLSIYSRIQTSNRKGRDTVSSLGNESNNEVYLVYLDLMTSPFRLITLTIFLTLLLPYALKRLFHRLRNSPPASLKLPQHIQYDTLINENEVSPAPEREYESRFLQDFVPEECLGIGGFGVVFKARNKMDDCCYAVKRILLPHNKKSREKVLREVRALAKLEHSAIVRYFNSWSEQPPPGWQKQQDEVLIHDLSSWSGLPHHTETEVESASSTDAYHESEQRQSSDSTRGFELVDKSSKESNLLNVGHSQGFTLNDRSNAHGFDYSQPSESSKSWADNLNHFEPIRNENLGGKFFDDDSSSESSNDFQLYQNNTRPFQNYESNSMSIVFGEQTQTKNKSTSKSSGQKSEVALTISHTNSSSTKEVKQDNKPNEEDSRDTVYLYIQMQLCKKESLKEWLTANKQRERNTCINIFCQVVNAVKYIHEKGLIHRDLKPSNVLFSLDNTIKVGDFGLVTHVGHLTHERFSCDNDPNRQHTKQVGTTLYMAPEQMEGAYTEKVDIYALGLIFYELLYLFETQMEKVRHFSDARKFKFPNDFRDNFPQGAELVRTMLHKNASSRPTAQDISASKLFTNNNF